jgi:hypothetical protein
MPIVCKPRVNWEAGATRLTVCWLCAPPVEPPSPPRAWPPACSRIRLRSPHAAVRIQLRVRFPPPASTSISEALLHTPVSTVAFLAPGGGLSYAVFCLQNNILLPLTLSIRGITQRLRSSTPWLVSSSWPPCWPSWPSRALSHAFGARTAGERASSGCSKPGRRGRVSCSVAATCRTLSGGRGSCYCRMALAPKSARAHVPAGR